MRRMWDSDERRILNGTNDSGFTGQYSGVVGGNGVAGVVG
jgi:hypothetical protein